MHFQRLQGRKSKALVEMIDDPIVIKLRDGTTYGGALDEYYYNSGGLVAPH